MRRFDEGGESLRSSESIIAPFQMSGKPRLFRSGVATLRYSSGTSCDNSDMAGGEEPLETDVIVIIDTPPSSPKCVLASDGANASGQCDETVSHDSIAAAGNADDDALDSVEQCGLRLREETRTITQVPRASGDRMRRILVRDTSDLGYCISMHGVVHEVGLKSIKYVSPLCDFLSAC